VGRQIWSKDIFQLSGIVHQPLVSPLGGVNFLTIGGIENELYGCIDTKVMTFCLVKIFITGINYLHDFHINASIQLIFNAPNSWKFDAP
jgi:hypothetical protein